VVLSVILCSSQKKYCCGIYEYPKNYFFKLFREYHTLPQTRATRRVRQWPKWTCLHCSCSHALTWSGRITFHALLLRWPWPWPDDLYIRTWLVSLKMYVQTKNGPSMSRFSKVIVSQTVTYTNRVDRSYCRSRFAGSNKLTISDIVILLWWTNVLEVSWILGLQEEHFTIKRTRSESSMMQRNEKSRAESSDTVRAETLQEKLWFETPPEGSQWRRRGDARRQTVPYARSHDRKCAIANA